MNNLFNEIAKLKEHLHENAHERKYLNMLNLYFCA